MIYFLITLFATSFLFPILIFRRLRFGKRSARRILVIHTAKIGDVVCSTPVFRELRKSYPQAYIAAAVNPLAAGVIENNPWVDEIIPMNTRDYKGFGGKLKLAKVLRSKKFDISVNLLPNLTNLIAPFWAMIPVRISISPENAGQTFKLCSLFASYLEKRSRADLVNKSYVKALRFLGLETENNLPEIFTSSQGDRAYKKFIEEFNITNKRLIGISVSCGNKMKAWPGERFAVLADLIMAKHCVQIIFIGSQSEYTGTKKVLSGMKNPAVNSCGYFSLSQLPSLLDRLSLFIGVDTGIVYMAAALGVPVIDIAGPCDMDDQRPLGAKCEIVQKDLPCVPCSHNFSIPPGCRKGDRECVDKISVEEVWERVQKMLVA